MKRASTNEELLAAGGVELTETRLPSEVLGHVANVIRQDGEPLKLVTVYAYPVEGEDGAYYVRISSSHETMGETCELLRTALELATQPAEPDGVH